MGYGSSTCGTQPGRVRSAITTTLAAEEEIGIFEGAWGIDLDNGLIYVSDRGNGIHAFRFSGMP
jgi:hypothetical protein